MYSSLLSFLLSFVMLLTSFFPLAEAFFQKSKTVNISVDSSVTGEIIPNIVSNSNVWYMGTQFYNPTADEEVMEFTEYIQLMQATGGTAERDLFKDPYDRTTFTDYDFTKLIENCKGILKLGAKPHLKLGSVPIKMTSGYKLGGFDMNVYPPDDYNVYYDYIKAVITALVQEFGKDEVLSWRFGCMTEYENSDWFMAKSGLPKDSAVEFCKLYDYTVQALTDVLGKDVFVGAHSMTVTEGLWDEGIFINHVANGINYANGEKGTLIRFLSTSFYDSKPGQFTSGYTLPECVKYLKSTAEKAGLKGLIYGVDEGRILTGNSKGALDDQLNSRTVGFTWQAAYDARIFKQGIDSGLDYFSNWYYLTGGLLNGYPTISYHVARNIYDFTGSCKIETKVDKGAFAGKGEVDCLSSFDKQNGKLRLMIYNFKNDVDYSDSMDLSFTLNIPQFAGHRVIVTEKVVGDNCNFFDEWQRDRIKYNIDDSCFAWSPDDPCIDTVTTLSSNTAREIYFSTLRDNYIEYSKLIPNTYEEMCYKDGSIKFNKTIEASNVIFLELSV